MANPNKGIQPQKLNKFPANTAFSADDYYLLYNQTAQQQPARTLHLVAIPLSLFGLFGLLWALPFPHLGFLGTYNGFFNWASFLLAFMIYFYLRLAPTVSYLILFFLLVCAYGVVQLSAWQVLNGPPLGAICGSLFLVSATALAFTGNRKTVTDKGKLLLAAPIWEVYTLLNKKPQQQ